MKLLHARGFSPAERKQWKTTILSNMSNAFQCIHTCMEDNHVAFAQPENAVCLQLLRRVWYGVTDTAGRNLSSSPARTLTSRRWIWRACETPSFSCGPTMGCRRLCRWATSMLCTITWNSEASQHKHKLRYDFSADTLAATSHISRGSSPQTSYRRTKISSELGYGRQASPRVCSSSKSTRIGCSTLAASDQNARSGSTSSTTCKSSSSSPR